MVFLNEDKVHNLCDGDTIIFSEVKGMTEINDKIYKVKVINPNSFKIGDTTSFNPYITGGIATQIKIPETV